MDYEKKYKDARQTAKNALDCAKQGLITTDKVLIERMFPELKESEDERVRKALIELFTSTSKKDWLNIPTEKIIAWLKKQKATDREIIFRPLAGTDIIAAANQALEKIEIGKEVILAFNGAYIPVNGKTVAEICNEYFSWTEKQGEKKVPSVDFKAKDCYVSKVDGNIHDMTYDAADKVEPKNMEDETKNAQETSDNWTEYVYILDYNSGRVIVVKHDFEESTPELLEKLGLKESQCHYMVSSDILSIEYINF